MGQVIGAGTFVAKLLKRRLASGAQEIRVPKANVSYETAVSIAMRYTAGLIVKQDAYLFTKRRVANLF